MNTLQKEYGRLDVTRKRVLQVMAFQHEASSLDAIHRHIKTFDLRQDNGRLFTQAFLRDSLQHFIRLRLLNTTRTHPHPDLMDLLIREGLSGNWARELVSLAKSASRWASRNPQLDFYLAFYLQDAEAWKIARRDITDGSIPLLSPFCENIFRQLKPQFQEEYFSFVLPAWITGTARDEQGFQALRKLLNGDAPYSNELMPQLVEWALASGDRALLERINDQTAGTMNDVEGCVRLLRGDFDTVFDLLSGTLSNRSNKRILTKFGGLPSVLATFAAVAGHPNAKWENAWKASEMAIKSGVSPYADAFAIVQFGLQFVSAPGDTTRLISNLNGKAKTPIAKWAAGYLQAWLASGGDDTSQVNGLIDAAGSLQASGCEWLAAEAYAAAGKSNLKTAEEQQKLAEQLHQSLETASLVRFVEPEPAWSRTLAAIAMLGSQKSPSAQSGTDPQATDRLIFEISHDKHDFQLEVFHQVRKGKDWSKGRKVALSRLFHQYTEPDFAFLTPEDVTLCQTLRNWSERGHYGYPEEYTEFETRSGSRALIGHPRIFRPGKRDQPLEIVEKPISLIVRELDDSQIELVLEPRPDGLHDVQFDKTATGDIAVTIFETSHLELQKMLGRGLRVPKSASAKVLEAVTQLASVVTIHSEIGDMGRGNAGQSSDGSKSGNEPTSTAARRIDGDAQLHLHLIPIGEGLRAELYVQPFGTTGPTCRPGEGGKTLFATIDGEATSADRDLTREVENAQSLIDRCQSFASHLIENWTASFPTPIESLELLLALESLNQNDCVSVHWPKGRSLRLAGEASESMMRVRIRRDRNWFAASGELKLDRDRTIDMMQLLDLVAASPGRFVQLDDGEFLALTSNLRRRIEDLRMFGDGRSAKGKLRFGAVHAELLENLGDVKVTSDAHWKKCLKRMRDSTEVEIKIPETLQAELRPYQHEGIAWMQRLAAWGVGGCLADDMGLGKTLQAIAVLLQRAAEGPAIVVAPTSVIHNWQDEIIRFAPTLRPRILAESSRNELLDSLETSDVLLCSYGLMQNEIDKLKKIDFATLILDEAQAIKNAATQRSKAAKQLTADCRYLLTGTPMENHLGELWNLMDFINPGLLGSSESFQDRFAIPIERDGDPVARQGLKRLVAPFILRRTKAQVLTELPPRIETTLRIQPSDDEAAFYEAVRLRAVEKLAEAADGKPQPLQILGEIMRMRRACCHPKLVMPESDIEGSKLAQVLETIDELRSGNHRALIFSQFVDHLQLVREQLDQRGIAYQYLDGSTPARTRKQSVDAFQAGEGEVFLISLKAGGTGLNLTAADYVIHLDPWWNPAVEDQASDRAHRIGQQRPVTIYRMILAGTIEEKILNLHATKRDLAESLLEGTDRSGKLTTDELLRLIKS
ncbi:DEAD/DEAH box helicase [Stieleria varia]|uniref:ATP-dependent helicase HepA n=1 Tax=Stieleria varia TaxID=2528005 RepID=A0A5C6B4A4_9BACT|nr:DEAD/DEAH box helicase [Stieleria varia]TWU06149.1 ATP-dependent helicase HepA [Stieleria varia]